MAGEVDENDGVDALQITAGGWVDKSSKAVRRDFVVAGVGDEPLRIAFSKDAHAQIVSHAGEDTSRELCGILLGTIYEDDDGRWVSADVALRGETDRQGGTHVTYTHQTWQKIYKVKDAEYPDLAILGWYHTHPGFGVQFSEMDLFIQRNFFPGESQFALVIDPIRSDEAIVANSSGRVEYVSRFWVDDQQVKALVPANIKAGKSSQSNNEPSALSDAESMGSMDTQSDMEDRLRNVEARLAQVLQATEAQRESHGRMFLMLGFLCTLLVAGFIVYSVLDREWNKVLPPEDLQMVNVPVRINDKVMMVGMQVRGWQIPDGENLLANAEESARKRALITAMQLMKNPDDQDAAAEVLAAKEKPLLSPVFTFYWALAASLLCVVVFVWSTFIAGEPKEQSR